MSRVLIIAEAGVNHNGSLEMAKQLIDVAAKAKVDFVKFQTFKAENLVSRKAQKAIYQQRNDPNSSSQFDMLKNLELSIEDHYALIEYCNNKNVKFFSTAFDLESISFLHSLGFELFKVPSGEINNLLYIREIAKVAKSVILSTGMCTMDDIEHALSIFFEHDFSVDKITILHCTTDYPTKLEDVNLKAMLSIANKFKVNIGYSDHTLGIEVPLAAVALGAKVIEKHFTLNRNLEGPDHIASLEPNELERMVEGIRKIEKALGSEIKQPTDTEKQNMKIARKSIHVQNPLKKGEKITESNLIMLRPGDGISPMNINLVIGRILLKDIPAGTKLDFSMFSNE